MAANHELKYIPVEIKEVHPDGTFTGLASQYGTEDLGGDVIDKGAFTKSLAENPVVPVLWQHDSREVIGKGTVKEWGNKITIDGALDMQDPIAVKAYNKMKAALVKGLSIGFTTVKSTWEDIQGRMVRHISELKLWEVSIVTFPMLPQAQVTRVKSAEEIELEERVARLEQALQATKGTPVPDPSVTDPQKEQEQKLIADFVEESEFILNNK